MPTWLAVQWSKAAFFLIIYYSINDMKTSELSALHLSCATSIFVVDCCKFGRSWMFVPKMELMACADLVGGTTEQNVIFPDVI